MEDLAEDRRLLLKIILQISVVKQKGMVFGFRKTATAVTRPERR